MLIPAALLALAIALSIASGVVTAHGGDPDGDGLTNQEEALWGTNKQDADTDHDWISDGDEVRLYNTDPTMIDSDSDGLTDWSEINTYMTVPWDGDSDDDGFSDGEEVAAGTNPLKPNSFPRVPR